MPWARWGGAVGLSIDKQSEHLPLVKLSFVTAAPVGDLCAQESWQTTCPGERVGASWRQPGEEGLSGRDPVGRLHSLKPDLSRGPGPSCRAGPLRPSPWTDRASDPWAGQCSHVCTGKGADLGVADVGSGSFSKRPGGSSRVVQSFLSFVWPLPLVGAPGRAGEGGFSGRG